MSFMTWWHHKNGKSKTLTVLCAVLILDIGLCFATPSAVDWINTIFHLRSQELEGLGYMMIQAVFCFILLVAIFCLGIFWRPGLSAPDRNKENHDR